MSMVFCKECKARVSNLKGICSQCGVTLMGDEELVLNAVRRERRKYKKPSERARERAKFVVSESPPRHPVQTIEQTSKELKLHVIVSTVSLVIFMLLLIAFQKPIFIFCTVASLLWVVALKLLIWWHHG